MKQDRRIRHISMKGRTPRGVRGLKQVSNNQVVVSSRSHPARGAWIETSIQSLISAWRNVAPREGCVD